jgi:hypothetical protein
VDQSKSETVDVELPVDGRVWSSAPVRIEDVEDEGP